MLAILGTGVILGLIYCTKEVWHNARNLIEGSSDHQQFEKLLEEVEELRLNIDDTVRTLATT